MLNQLLPQPRSCWEYGEAGTAAFIEENARFANDLFDHQEQVEGLIRLRRPVPLEALPALVVADPSRVQEYYLEYATDSGEIVTIGGAPKGDVFLPTEELRAWEAVAATNSGEGKTNGFTRIVMTMTRDEYEALAREADVWFVDVTVEYAIQDAIQQSFASSGEQLSVAPLFPYIPAATTADRPDPGLLIEKHFDGWMYVVGQESDGLITVAVGITGTDGLKSYYLQTQQVAETLFDNEETADVYVRFREPLLESELPAVIQSAPEQVKRYALLYLDPQGRDFWIATERSDNNAPLLNREQLQEEFPQLAFDQAAENRKEGNDRLVGFAQLDMTVTREQYKALLDSPEVLAVDIGPAIALYEAGLGTHWSNRIIFVYPLHSLSPAEQKLLESLR